MKRVIRLAFVHLLYGLGLLQLLAWIVLRRRAVVLMYHRVMSPEALTQTWSHPGIVVSRATFERHLRLLRRHFRVLTAEQFLSCLDRRRFEPRSCLVTFDDGWIDTYLEAWSALRRHGVSALIFLPSAYIGTSEVFWQERLGGVLDVIWRQSRADATFVKQARTALSAFGLESILDFDEANRRQGILDVVRSRKADGTLDPAAPVRALQSLAVKTVDATSNVDRFIDWEQALEMARDGVTFGAHGDTHRRLTTLPAGELRREVEASRDVLSRRLGCEVTAFCYPNGDWNVEVAEAVAAGRFQMAFSTERGHVAPDADRFALRRVNVHEDMTRSTPMFLARILGVV